MSNTPVIAANQHVPEITLRVICLSLLLTVLLAAANTYLALKIGMLTSASIPAAVLSMGILRLFKDASILENNLVQTTAAAGEAVAGGIVYTVPALIMIHYWLHFPYWQSFAIAAIGGLLGALYSIPLRRVLVNDSNLHFPEGRATAEVLKYGMQERAGLRELLLGGIAGSLLELLQSGFKVVASALQSWHFISGRLFGFGMGCSATLLGAGYLIGFSTGFSLLLGAIIGWLIGVPLVSTGIIVDINGAQQLVTHLWETKLRFVGIGAMLTAGLWMLTYLIKPCCASFYASWQAVSQRDSAQKLPRTEQDLPRWLVGLGLGLLLFALLILLQNYLSAFGNPAITRLSFMLSCIGYVVIIGFFAAAVCGYFSGLLGVTATPGSAVMIAVFILAAVILHLVLPNSQMLQAAAISILLGALVTGCACVADNMQVFKVGHLLGATPWKQQLMFIFGVVLAAAIIPLVMELLFNVYGIADVLPHVGMDKSQTLPAPPAAMMATMTQAVFQQDLPWHLLDIGVMISIALIVLSKCLARLNIKLSPLAVATGIYLALPTSTALFIGSLFAWLAKRARAKHTSATVSEDTSQRCLLLACGLMAGAAIMDVLLAIPFALAHNPDVLKVNVMADSRLPAVLGLLTVFLLGRWFYRLAKN